MESGLPPLALLLDAPKRKYCAWDMKLIKAYYLEQSYDVEGFPIWVEESSDIMFTPKKKRIRSIAAVEERQEREGNKKTKEFGVRYYAEAKLKTGAKWPTRENWLNTRSKNTEPDGERDIKIAEREAMAEQRARDQIAGNEKAQAVLAKFNLT